MSRAQGDRPRETISQFSCRSRWQCGAFQPPRAAAMTGLIGAFPRARRVFVRILALVCSLATARRHASVRHQREHAQRLPLPSLILSGPRSRPRRSAAADRDWSGTAARSGQSRACSSGRIGWPQVKGLAGVGADRLEPSPGPGALPPGSARQRCQAPACAGRSRRDSGRPRDRCVSTSLCASGSMTPRNAAVTLLPIAQEADGQQKVRVGRGFARAVEHAGRRDEMSRPGWCRCCCRADAGRRSSGSARRNACRCARCRRSCSSTRRVRARHSASLLDAERPGLPHLGRQHDLRKVGRQGLREIYDTDATPDEIGDQLKQDGFAHRSSSIPHIVPAASSRSSAFGLSRHRSSHSWAMSPG